MTTTQTKTETLGDDYLDDAKLRWNRGCAFDRTRPYAADAEWDSKNPRRIVITNINGEIGAYRVTAKGELALERGSR